MGEGRSSGAPRAIAVRRRPGAPATAAISRRGMQARAHDGNSLAPHPPRDEREGHATKGERRRSANGAGEIDQATRGPGRASVTHQLAQQLRDLDAKSEWGRRVGRKRECRNAVGRKRQLERGKPVRFESKEQTAHPLPLPGIRRQGCKARGGRCARRNVRAKGHVWVSGGRDLAPTTGGAIFGGTHRELVPPGVRRRAEVALLGALSPFSGSRGCVRCGRRTSLRLALRGKALAIALVDKPSTRLPLSRDIASLKERQQAMVGDSGDMRALGQRDEWHDDLEGAGNARSLFLCDSAATVCVILCQYARAEPWTL